MVLDWKGFQYRLEIKKNFFAMRLVRHQNRFPGEAVDAPTL